MTKCYLSRFPKETGRASVGSVSFLRELIRLRAGCRRPGSRPAKELTMTTTETDTRGPAPIPQGDLRLLDTDLSRELLQAAIPVRMAFVAADGTPRIVPTW